MSEMVVVLGLMVLVGLVALGLGFVVLVVRGGSLRLNMKGAGTSLENEVRTYREGQDAETAADDSGGVTAPCGD